METIENMSLNAIQNTLNSMEIRDPASYHIKTLISCVTILQNDFISIDDHNVIKDNLEHIERTKYVTFVKKLQKFNQEW
jgi:hypothetical protein